jgi:hypothetical protein
MKAVLFLSALALCAAPAAAADSGQCDAKPFTLNKPAQPVKAPDQTKTAEATSGKAKPAKVAAKAKPPLLAGCKSGKAKKNG